MRVDSHLLISFRRGERLGCGGARGRRRVPILGELLAAREQLGALALDRGGVHFTRAHEITNVRLHGREIVSNALGIAARTLRRREALFGIFTAALGVGAFRKDLALRFFSGEELFVKTSGHRPKLRRRIAVGTGTRLDKTRKAGEDQESARRDDRAGSQYGRRHEGRGVVRREEDRDAIRDSPATLRHGGVGRDR